MATTLICPSRHRLIWKRVFLVTVFFTVYLLSLRLFPVNRQRTWNLLTATDQALLAPASGQDGSGGCFLDPEEYFQWKGSKDMRSYKMMTMKCFMQHQLEAARNDGFCSVYDDDGHYLGRDACL